MIASQKEQHVINTIKSMFQHRKYIDISEQPTKQKIKSMNVLEMTATYRNNRGVPIKENVYCIIVPLQGKKSSSSIGKNDITQYLSDKQECSNLHLIVVCTNLTFQAREYLKNNNKESNLLVWEMLSYHHLLFDIMSHIRVPTYHLLNSEQLKEVEKKYGSSDFFPKLVANYDPVAKYMNYIPGDVLRVEKRSAIGGYSIFYRKVIHYNELS